MANYTGKQNADGRRALHIPERRPSEEQELVETRD
jgi:hypothetical protein